MKTITWRGLLAAAALAATVPCAMAQDKDKVPDALDLPADEPPEKAPAAAAGGSAGASKLFVEAAAGHASRRYGLDAQTLGRLSLDGRTAGSLGGGFRAALSARVDALEPEDEVLGRSVLSLREAYLSWQDAGGGAVVDVGRLNLREGPGYGYNPTDWFRTGTLRTITTQDPVAQRELRLGTAMLRVQTLWDGGSLTLAYAPRLDDAPSRDGWSADWGATNQRHRAVVALGTRWSDSWSSRLLAFKEEGAAWAVGASVSGLLSDALVAHGEWTYGREAALAARAQSAGPATELNHRATVGLTWTTAGNLSLTGELAYNGFALDRGGWQALAASGTPAAAAYYGTAAARNDLSTRDAVLLYAVQRDLFVRKLDFTALVRLNRNDRSRLTWLDLRYRMDRFDVALQWQQNHGEANSEFGIIPIRNAFGVVAAFYFL